MNVLFFRSNPPKTEEIVFHIILKALKRQLKKIILDPWVLNLVLFSVIFCVFLGPTLTFIKKSWNWQSCALGLGKKLETWRAHGVFSAGSNKFFLVGNRRRAKETCFKSFILGNSFYFDNLMAESSDRMDLNLSSLMELEDWELEPVREIPAVTSIHFDLGGSICERGESDEVSALLLHASAVERRHSIELRWSPRINHVMTFTQTDASSSISDPTAMSNV